MAESFYDVVNQAVDDIATHGYDSAERLAFWQQRIRESAEQTLTPVHVMEQALREALTGVYKRMIERGQIARMHPGVSRYTIDKLIPRLRNELDRRILAAADLIRLNRSAAIETTLRRFSGWSTSIPVGGSGAIDEPKARQQVKKSLKSMPFEARRVLIDQGHKLTASLSEVVAKEGQAIAGRWRSHWRQPGYDYREDHKERDGKVYLVRASWADERKLVQGTYYDEVTAAGQEVFCRCQVVWLYALRDMPVSMLSDTGKEALRQARTKLKEVA